MNTAVCTMARALMKRKSKMHVNLTCPLDRNTNWRKQCNEGKNKLHLDMQLRLKSTLRIKELE